jgi:hypothetical protein
VIEKHLQNGADVAIVGYGAINEDGSGFDTRLREAFTTVTDRDCTAHHGCFSPSEELGAGGNGIDACFGDSGGPLYLLTEYVDYVVGITSRAYSDADLPCFEGGIYTRPDAIMDWLDTNTGYDIPRATCNTPPSGSAVRIEAEEGKVGSKKIQVNDADASNAFSFRVVDGPANGQATVDGSGKASYQGNDGYLGEDSFTVEVSDDGVPSLSTTVEVMVDVVPAGCGCRTGVRGAASHLWLVGVVLVLVFRRRPRA